MNIPQPSAVELPSANTLLQGKIEDVRRAAEAVGQRERRLERLNAILVELATHASSEAADLKSSLRKLMEYASMGLAVDRASVWLLAEDGSGIRLLDLYDGRTSQHSEDIALKAADFPAYFGALQTERCIAAHDARTDPRTREFRDCYLAPLGIVSMLDASVRLNGRVVGVVCNEQIGEARTWTPEEQSFAGSIADRVALALEAHQRSRTEEALRRSEDQFRQAQKMEAVGRLAGGVAHDFNNLLTVILGFSENALLSLDERDPLRSDLDEIRKAGERAATLTRQLLAFSRKQVLQPKVLDLNEMIVATEKMLRRLIGEDIELVTRPSPDLGKLKADPGQVEQVILNLVVNARDAMPRGGTLILETANADLDENYAGGHPGARVGRFVTLAVTDTGTGMTDEVKARLFEPFFTTKEQGKGTGLGLSTVYGIVKQSGGNIDVSSELGRGTTFKIFLPRVEGRNESTFRRRLQAAHVKGKETILLVEDEEAVRSLARGVLARHGYTVLEARHGGEALLLCERSTAPIQLVLTDMVMPGMTGSELVRRLRDVRPCGKTLFMSGYTDTSLIQLPDSASDEDFLQKPFSPQSLLNKVREVLDSSAA